MRFIKKLLVVSVVLAFTFSVVSAIASPDEITVTIDGVPVVFEGQGPIITGNRTLVPVRGVFEALGFVPDWDPDARAATLVREDYTVVLTIGSYTFTTNGVEHTLDVPAQIVANRTLLPLRAVLESVGYDDMDWLPETRTVVILTGAEVMQTPTPSPEPSPQPGETNQLQAINIQIEVATDELLDTFTHIHEADYYLVRGSTNGLTLVIWADVPLAELAILDFSNDSTEDAILFIPIGTYGQIDVLQPGESFIIINYIGVGTLPWSGITFVDEDGVTRYFWMQENQSDYGDRFFLNEFKTVNEDGTLSW